MNTSTIWTTVKDELRERREARAAHNALRADLAHYRTPSDIEDLLATVDTQDTPEAELIRDVLMDNLRVYYHQRSAALAHRPTPSDTRTCRRRDSPSASAGWSKSSAGSRTIPSRSMTARDRVLVTVVNDDDLGQPEPRRSPPAAPRAPPRSRTRDPRRFGRGASPPPHTVVNGSGCRGTASPVKPTIAPVSRRSTAHSPQPCASMTSLHAGDHGVRLLAVQRGREVAHYLGIGIQLAAKGLAVLRHATGAAPAARMPVGHHRPRPSSAHRVTSAPTSVSGTTSRPIGPGFQATSQRNPSGSAKYPSNPPHSRASGPETGAPASAREVQHVPAPRRDSRRCAPRQRRDAVTVERGCPDLGLERGPVPQRTARAARRP